MSEAPRPGPNGIYPESGFRLPTPPDTVGLGVGLRGPAGITLYSPAFAKMFRDTINHLRRDCGLDMRLLELTSIVAAREAHNAFEWTYHERFAREAGVEPEVIEVVAYRRPVTGLKEADALLITLGRQCITEKKVPQETFDAAMRIWGPKLTVDLIGLMSVMVSSAMFMDAFDMQLPDGMASSLPRLEH